MTSSFFFFNATATTEIYTLSLHDALPIWPAPSTMRPPAAVALMALPTRLDSTCRLRPDRKSTRLNSSHVKTSYAVFCLNKRTQETAPSLPPDRDTAPSPARVPPDLFFLMIPRRPRSTLFPYTTLFRSCRLRHPRGAVGSVVVSENLSGDPRHPRQDRKSTRLNSSHVKSSYAVFCLKKKKRPSMWTRPVRRNEALRPHA